MQLIKKILFILFVTLIPSYAMAYVGPGIGTGTIGVVLGILGSIFIAMFAMLWYPFKRLLKKMKKKVGRNNSKQQSG